MYKYWFCILLFLLLASWIFEVNILDSKQDQIIAVSQQLDSIIYVDKIEPLVMWIQKNPSFEYYKIDGSGSLPNISNENTVIFKNLFVALWAQDIYNTNHSDNKEIQIRFSKNLNVWVYNCTYIYWKDAFVNRGIIWSWVADPQLFEEFWAKFAKNRLIKINDNYAKYCSYPLFD